MPRDRIFKTKLELEIERNMEVGLELHLVFNIYLKFVAKSGLKFDCV